MRIKFTYLLPTAYVVLAILAVALGPLGMFIFYLGMPLSVYVSEWYKQFGDPTYVAMFAVMIQYLVIGFLIDLWLYVYRTKLSADR